MISFPQLPLSSSAIFALSLSTFGHVATADVDFHTDIEPILSEFCYDCHGDGENKGKVAFDEFKSDAELLEKRDLWHSVLNNVRTGIMPPERSRGHPQNSGRCWGRGSSALFSALTRLILIRVA